MIFYYTHITIIEKTHPHTEGYKYNKKKSACTKHIYALNFLYIFLFNGVDFSSTFIHRNVYMYLILLISIKCGS